MSINRVMVTGNLTKDPDTRQVASGMTVMTMRVAVNDRRKNSSTGQWEDSPNYFDVVMFGSRAESLSRFVKKGTKIAVDGKLRWSEWENPAGEKRSKIEIVADDVELLTPREGGAGATYGGGGGGGSAASPGPIEDLEGEEIPF